VQNKIDFLHPPKDGETVAATFRTWSGKTTKYLRGFEEQRKILKIWAVIEETKEPVEVQDENGTLIFNPQDIVDGRSVLVAWDFGEKTKNHTLALRALPMANTLKILSDRQGVDCMQNVLIQNKVLTFECSNAEVNSIAINYSFIKSHSHIFTIGSEIPTGTDTYWRVYLNDKEIYRFKRNGSVLELDPADVPEHSKVKVHVFVTPPTTLVQ